MATVPVIGRYGCHVSNTCMFDAQLSWVAQCTLLYTMVWLTVLRIPIALVIGDAGPSADTWIRGTGRSQAVVIITRLICVDGRKK